MVLRSVNGMTASSYASLLHQTSAKPNSIGYLFLNAHTKQYAVLYPVKKANSPQKGFNPLNFRQITIIGCKLKKDILNSPDDSQAVSVEIKRMREHVVLKERKKFILIRLINRIYDCILNFLTGNGLKTTPTLAIELATELSKKTTPPIIPPKPPGPKPPPTLPPVPPPVPPSPPGPPPPPAPPLPPSPPGPPSPPPPPPPGPPPPSPPGPPMPSPPGPPPLLPPGPPPQAPTPPSIPTPTPSTPPGLPPSGPTPPGPIPPPSPVPPGPSTSYPTPTPTVPRTPPGPIPPGPLPPSGSAPSPPSGSGTPPAPPAPVPSPIPTSPRITPPAPSGTPDSSSNGSRTSGTGLSRTKTYTKTDALDEYKKDPSNCPDFLCKIIFKDIKEIDSKRLLVNASTTSSLVHLIRYMSTDSKTINLRDPLSASIIVNALKYGTKETHDQLVEWLSHEKTFNVRLLKSCLEVLSQRYFSAKQPISYYSLRKLMWMYIKNKWTDRKDKGDFIIAVNSPSILDVLRILLVNEPNEDDVRWIVRQLMDVSQFDLNAFIACLRVFITKAGEENKVGKNMFYPVHDDLIECFEKNPDWSAAILKDPSLADVAFYLRLR